VLPAGIELAFEVYKTTVLTVILRELNLVEDRRIELLTPPCKGGVIPLY
jgi:hypothetical protein